MRFRNNMSMRFHTTILCVFEREKTCGLRFHNTPTLRNQRWRVVSHTPEWSMRRERNKYRVMLVTPAWWGSSMLSASDKRWDAIIPTATYCGPWGHWKCKTWKWSTKLQGLENTGHENATNTAYGKPSLRKSRDSCTWMSKRTDGYVSKCMTAANPYIRLYRHWGRDLQDRLGLSIQRSKKRPNSKTSRTTQESKLAYRGSTTARTHHCSFFYCSQSQGGRWVLNATCCVTWTAHRRQTATWT